MIWLLLLNFALFKILLGHAFLHATIGRHAHTQMVFLVKVFVWQGYSVLHIKCNTLYSIVNALRDFYHWWLNVFSSRWFSLLLPGDLQQLHWKIFRNPWCCLSANSDLLSYSDLWHSVTCTDYSGDLGNKLKTWLLSHMNVARDGAQCNNISGINHKVPQKCWSNKAKCIVGNCILCLWSNYGYENAVEPFVIDGSNVCQ